MRFDFQSDRQKLPVDIAYEQRRAHVYNRLHALTERQDKLVQRRCFAEGPELYDIQVELASTTWAINHLMGWPQP